jgi:hypothetical protein
MNVEKSLIYAGIGSRKTPIEAQIMMTEIAKHLGPSGWKLRSGHADSADKAFEKGAVISSSPREIHLPWGGYNNQIDDNVNYFVPDPRIPNLLEVTARNHPIWDKLGLPIKNLMVRNTTIVCGLDMQTPVQFIAAWTKDGREEGGTSHAMRVARDPYVVELVGHPIPVFNLARVADQQKLIEFVQANTI